MTALDLSKKALGVARKNIQRHGLEKKIRLIQSDLFASLDRAYRGYWNLIVSNPPYIDSKDLRNLPREVRREPRPALDGGPQGLAVIFKILAQAPAYLQTGGWLVLEIGAGQARVLKEKIERGGFFKNLRFVKDHAGIDRVLICQKVNSLLKKPQMRGAGKRARRRYGNSVAQANEPATKQMRLFQRTVNG